MRDREALGRDGFVMITALVNDRTGKILSGPEIISRGFVYVQSAEELFTAMRDLVRKVVAEAKNGNREQLVQEAVKKFLYNETKRRPMVFAQMYALHES
jgi:ribonuclease J